MKAVVLLDEIRWHEDGVLHTAAKGAEVDLSQDEYDRLEAADAVAKPRSQAATGGAVSGDGEGGQRRRRRLR